MIELRQAPRRLVLVADDDEDILQLLSFRFERAGYQVVQARNGEEALRLALELIPELAILDVMMPGLSGVEVTRELRANPPTSIMPIVLLTAKAQAAEVTGGLTVGADDYVKKPFDAHDLIERVDRMIRMRLVSSAD